MIKTLSNEEIAYAAPSVATMEARGDLSERYEVFPTMQVVNRLREHGWMPTMAQQSKSKDANNKPFAKHLVTFTHARALGAQDASSLPQILITNSHDGATAYRVQAGIFRIACANGLVVMSQCIESVSIRHFGRDNTMDAILNATETIATSLPQVGETIKRMEHLELSTEEQLEFARNAVDARWHGDAPDVPTGNLLMHRRSEDRGNSLWKTFNRVQEALVKGGNRYYENGRRGKVRAVTGVDSSLQLNARLWSLAESYLN